MNRSSFSRTNTQFKKIRTFNWEGAEPP